MGLIITYQYRVPMGGFLNDEKIGASPSDCYVQRFQLRVEEDKKYFSCPVKEYYNITYLPTDVAVLVYRVPRARRVVEQSAYSVPFPPIRLRVCEKVPEENLAWKYHLS